EGETSRTEAPPLAAAGAPEWSEATAEQGEEIILSADDLAASLDLQQQWNQDQESGAAPDQLSDTVRAYAPQGGARHSDEPQDVELRSELAGEASHESPADSAEAPAQGETAAHT